MPSSLLFPASLFAAAMLASCVSPQLQARFLFPRVDVYGPYAREWKLDDLRQLRELVRNRADIKKPIDQIEVYRADEARVKSGSPWQDEKQIGTSFSVRKENGRWMIVAGSVSTGPAIVLAHPING